MTVTTLLIIVLILLLIGALPVYPHSTAWGWGPSGVLAVLAVILLVLALTGRL